MKTKEFLSEAIRLSGTDRQKDYGDKIENHNNEIELKDIFLDSLSEVLDENDKSRILEGTNLKDDLIERITIIKKYINDITLMFKDKYKENFKKYKLKIFDL